jgi:TatD DNase family protein
VFANALQGETEEQIDASIEDGAYKSKQAILFEQQLDLAVELGLNVVIHQRDAWEDTLEMMRPYTDKVRGVFHCFGGSLEQANEVFDLDHLVSFTGIVTFKNGASVRAVAAQIPLWKFMVETDCPYLAPVPFRGKRCEPAYTRLVAESIASAREIPLEELAEATTETAEKFFRFNRR